MGDIAKRNGERSEPGETRERTDGHLLSPPHSPSLRSPVFLSLSPLESFTGYCCVELTHKGIIFTFFRVVGGEGWKAIVPEIIYKTNNTVRLPNWNCLNLLYLTTGNVACVSTRHNFVFLGAFVRVIRLKLASRKFLFLTLQDRVTVVVDFSSSWQMSTIRVRFFVRIADWNFYPKLRGFFINFAYNSRQKLFSSWKWWVINFPYKPVFAFRRGYPRQHISSMQELWQESHHEAILIFFMKHKWKERIWGELFCKKWSMIVTMAE